MSLNLCSQSPQAVVLCHGGPREQTPCPCGWKEPEAGPGSCQLAAPCSEPVFHLQMGRRGLLGDGDVAVTEQGWPVVGAQQESVCVRAGVPSRSRSWERRGSEQPPGSSSWPRGLPVDFGLSFSQFPELFKLQAAGPGALTTHVPGGYYFILGRAALPDCRGI